MRIIIWISLCASLTIAHIVDAQRNFNLSKPIESLEKRPRTPTWQRPPEERRKLSIFPRNNKKFVVTPNTVPKTEEQTARLSINRPVMRKFVVQEKSEKGAWYFAPRKPLMKTKRFIVNDAPQKLDEMRDKSNSNNETFAEKVVESKKMKPLVNYIKNEPINEVQINKANFVNVWENKKANLTTLKDFKPVGKVQEGKLNNYVSNLVGTNNDVKKVDNSVISDSKTNMTIVDVVQDNYELEEEKRSPKAIQSSSLLKIKDTLTETVEDRSSDFKEMELLDEINDENNDSLNLNELKYNENIVIDTENFNVVTPVRDVNSSIANNTMINTSTEDEPHELDMTPNNFYEVKSFDNVKDYFDGSIIEVSQSLGNENANGLSGIEHSNIKNYLNEYSGNTFIIDGLDRIEYMESDLNTKNIPEDMISSKPQVPIEQDLDKYVFEDYTGDPITITTDVKTSTYEPITFEPNLNIGPQTECPSELIFDKVGNLSTEQSISEIDTSHSQNSEEIHEPSNNESTSQITDDLMHEQADISGEIPQEVTIVNLNNVRSEEISNEPSYDKTNNFTGEEISSEFMTDNSNNLTAEEVSNESNMAGEEVSNEYLIGNLSGEISDESLVDKSKEDVSDESTIEPEIISAKKEISIEALVNRYKRNNNIIEEENQATTITSFKYTGQPTRLGQDLSFKNINA